jgi:glycosyltransferase involved in cell wall biosynthesis
VPAPIVDVVIDNFDYGRFLGAAIDSALSQTHAHTRVTVVDDGSRDDSLAVARAYGDRIRVIAKPNGGQASALNAGAAATAGDLVAFLDADDVLRPGFAAAAVDALTAQPDAVKVVFRAEVIDATGVPTGRVEPSPHLPLAHGDLRGATLANAFDLVWPPLSAHVFRRSALADVLPIPEDEFRTLADWYLAHATSLLGPVVALEQAGVRYRLHGDNAYLLGHEGDSLAQIRTSIVHAERTTRQLDRIARARRLIPPGRVEISTATAARRLVSLRLDPQGHPLPGDRR